MLVLKWSLWVLAGLVVLVVIAGQAGWLAGRPPQGLGLKEGRLKAPSRTPNSVSSQAHLWTDHERREQAQIDPLPLVGDGMATMARIKSLVESMAGADVVESTPDYLYARFTTRWMGFVDDTEFWFDPTAQVIQVRSASRVGKSDLDVNRRRIEAIRARLAGG